MKYLVSFFDEVEAASEEEAYEVLLRYLRDCVRFEDVTGFEFKEEEDE